MKTSEWQTRIIPEPNSGCLLWEGATNSAGYGQITRRRSNPRSLFVHRLAWEEAHGPVPDGMLVCHHCDVRACCNPAHMFLGTPRDNMQDKMRKGRAVWRFETHCKRGHEFTSENTYVWGKTRICRACRRLRDKARRPERKL